MAHLSLSQLRDAAHTAGVEAKPMAALLAAIALEESGGNPDDVKAGDRGTSFGLLQVHQPDHEAVALATRAAMHVPWVTSYGRAVAEMKLALGILDDAFKQAIEAGKVLDSRGMHPDLSDVLVMTDAAWQGPGVVSWAERTTTGNPDEIREGSSPGRAQRVRDHLAVLGVAGGRGKWGWVLPVAVVAGAGLIGWAIVEGWDG